MELKRVGELSEQYNNALDCGFCVPDPSSSEMAMLLLMAIAADLEDEMNKDLKKKNNT